MSDSVTLAIKRLVRTTPPPARLRPKKKRIRMFGSRDGRPDGLQAGVVDDERWFSGNIEFLSGPVDPPRSRRGRGTMTPEIELRIGPITLSLIL